MKYIIDENICKGYNLTPNECLLLALIIKEQNISKTLQSLIAKNFISPSVLKEGEYITSDTSREVLAAILIESEPKVVSEEEEITQLAKEMQEIFPKGRKSGTTYYWRCSTLEIVRKLKTLIGKYNIHLDKDKVLTATKDYVQSFNGDYTKMRLLKYFILKTVKDSDGNITVYSDLLSLLENAGQNETPDIDWTDRVI